MLYVAQVAVCSEINTKYINTVWKEGQCLSVNPVGAKKNGSFNHTDHSFTI